MKIFITGGLGFVGRQLTQALLEDGHQVTGVGRSANPTTAIEHPSFSYLAADTTVSGDWQERAAGLKSWRKQNADLPIRISTARSLKSPLVQADDPASRYNQTPS